MDAPSPSLDSVRRGVERYLSVKSSYSPRFSPDGRRIAYLTDLTGVPQIWTKELEGDASPQQLTTGEERVGFLSYARMSESIAYGVDSGGDERYQIRLLGEGGRRVSLTCEPSVIHNWGDWSPDETRACYSSNARDPRFFDLYVGYLDDLSSELVHEHDGNNYPVAWSPDGSSILFSRMHAPFDNDLHLLHLGDGEAELLTQHEGEAAFHSASFDPSGGFLYCITDLGREFASLARIDARSRSVEYLYGEERELEELALSRDGKRLAFTVNEDGWSRLMLMEPGGSPRRLPVPRGVLGGLEWSSGGDTLAFTLSSSAMNGDVWAYSIDGGKAARVVRSPTSGIPESSFAEARLVSRDSGGVKVPAFLYVPEGKAGAPPLLVYLHGGPESQFRPGFSPLIQYFVRLGFAVLAPNFRGSTGYGRRYTHLDDVCRRMDAVADVHSLVEQVVAEGSVDGSRVAAWGGSYGGFMVLACLYTKPDLWRAGVDIVGISNLVTFLRNTGPWRRALRIPEYGDPERDEEFLLSISPTTNAHLIRAPLFIIHGANDPRVPAGEAEQIAETMGALGQEAHLLKFEDEGHGLVKLKNRVAGYSAAVEFLLRHVAPGE